MVEGNCPMSSTRRYYSAYCWATFPKPSFDPSTNDTMRDATDGIHTATATATELLTRRLEIRIRQRKRTETCLCRSLVSHVVGWGACCSIAI